MFACLFPYIKKKIEKEFTVRRSALNSFTAHLSAAMHPDGHVCASTNQAEHWLCLLSPPTHHHHRLFYPTVSAKTSNRPMLKRLHMQTRARPVYTQKHRTLQGSYKALGSSVKGGRLPNEAECGCVCVCVSVEG